jgi:hypothetical protein
MGDRVLQLALKTGEGSKEFSLATAIKQKQRDEREI